MLPEIVCLPLKKINNTCLQTKVLLKLSQILYSLSRTKSTNLFSIQSLTHSRGWINIHWLNGVFFNTHCLFPDPKLDLDSWGKIHPTPIHRVAQCLSLPLIQNIGLETFAWGEWLKVSESKGNPQRQAQWLSRGGKMLRQRVIDRFGGAEASGNGGRKRSQKDWKLTQFQIKR